MLTDEQLLQYSRHLMLPEVDMSGQQAWLDARVLVIGLGGLGSPVSLYLASAGVGKVTLVDDDRVELSNLQRQIAHTHERIGQFKAESAAHQMEQINPAVSVDLINARLDEAQMREQIQKHDLVIDCTDNFATRHLLNRLAFECSVPLVSGAAIRFEGQITVYDPRNLESPCYRCLYPEDARVEQNCSTSGVFSPVVGIVGTIQAAEALKVLAQIGTPLVGRLLLLDALSMEWRSFNLKPDPNCPVCSDR